MQMRALIAVLALLLASPVLADTTRIPALGGLPAGWTIQGMRLTAPNTSATSPTAQFSIGGTINAANTRAAAVEGLADSSSPDSLTITGTPLLGHGAIGGHFSTTSGGGGSSNQYIGVYGQANGNARRSWGVVGYQISSAVDKGAGGYFGCDGTAANPCAGLYAQLGSAEPATIPQAAGVLDNGTVAAPIAVFRDNGAEVVRIGDGGTLAFVGQANVTVDAATTFAVSNSYMVLICTGAETINTITGAPTGTILYLENSDTDCTIADDDDPTAANAVDLTGVATNDVGAVSKVLTLIYTVGGFWRQVSESDN